ncbi:MAG TPA: PIG-L family deacetylase, partial [Terrimicrobiaceae bacterium]
MSVYRELLHISQSINVIHIGAHPDDEDTGLISYLSNKYGMRVFYWSATRGEKGHNHSNTLHDAALGILRTWESLDAAAINHSECIFGPFIDFGFTKNAKTALMYWNHLESLDDIDWTNERITKEIVRTIRQYKPLIIISRWSGAPADFHGHHQAVGLATRAAFDLAGQPHVFQELEDEDLYPWQPLKLYISTDNSAGMQTFGGALNLSGKQNYQLENQPNIITINTGELEPDSQNTYQERGWLAYGQHRSQGMAQPSAPGDFKYYFELAKSLCGQGVDFLGGIDPSLRGLARLLNLTDPSSLSALNHAQQLCDETLNLHLTGERQQCAQRLLSLLSTLRTFNQDLKGSNLTPTNIHALKCYIEHKIRQTEELICTLFHLRFEALIDGMYFVQGTQNGISLQLFAYGNAVVDHVEFGLDVPAIATLTKKSDFDFSLSPNDPDAITSARLFRQDYRLYTGFGEMDTEVYWLRQPNDGRLYDWEDSPYAGRA